VSDLASVSDPHVQALAREILAREEYARFRVLENEWLADWLAWLARALEGLVRLRAESPWLWALLLLGLLAIAALLLAHVLYSLRAALRAAGPSPRPRSAREPKLDREAEDLAAAGRFLDAAHAMHLACLRRLLDRGAFELRRHDPNPVLRARIVRSTLAERERGEFLALLDGLETRWFRDRAPAADDQALFEAWRGLHQRLAASA
jgi:hypothetical protein